ncbi:MAG: hypothetical protein H7A20_04920 [Rhodanobacteraceae bacterium]|nr:hypothetical protein [Rhodanobacteraceae bacterium]
MIFAAEVLGSCRPRASSIHDGEVGEEAPSPSTPTAAWPRHAAATDALVGTGGAQDAGTQSLALELPDGYTSELLLPPLPYSMQAVGGGLRRGLALFVDYGYPRREFYLPERSDGTPQPDYRHRAHGDALLLDCGCRLRQLAPPSPKPATTPASPRRLQLAGAVPARQRSAHSASMQLWSDADTGSAVPPRPTGQTQGPLPGDMRRTLPGDGPQPRHQR